MDRPSPVLPDKISEVLDGRVHFTLIPPGRDELSGMLMVSAPSNNDYGYSYTYIYVYIYISIYVYMAMKRCSGKMKTGTGIP